MPTTTPTIAAALAAAGLAAGAADANTVTYEAVLDDLSGLGGSARADIEHDTDTNELWVRIQGGGFAKNMRHLQHIHGRFDADGSPRDSVTPTLADDDADGDGVVELLEGAPRYGGILLSLFDEDAAAAGDAFDGFPSAPSGIIDFAHTYDLDTTGALNPDKNMDGTADDPVTAADLFPLTKREIVIHGAFLEPGIGGVGNEGPGDPLFDEGGYSQLVPVAAGEITRVTAPIPLPAAGWALLAGLGGLGALRRFRRA